MGEREERGGEREGGEREGRREREQELEGGRKEKEREGKKEGDRESLLENRWCEMRRNTFVSAGRPFTTLPISALSV